ncbi:MAG: ADP-ribose diphosphatase, partial [Rheinheimera sp.]
IHLFLGELTAPVQTGVFGLPEEHEDIRVHLMPRRAAMELLSAGKIDNAATVIALQWLELHHSKICAAWE